MISTRKHPSLTSAAVEAGNLALSLDFDGVLVELADHPDLIAVNESLTSLLADVHTRLAGRLIILTGRSIDDISEHLPRISIPIYGSHGAEVLENGQIERLAEPLSKGSDLMAACADFCRGHPSLYLEEKTFGFAIHYRSDPSLGPTVHAFLEDVLVGNRDEVKVQPAKCAYELKPAAVCKGAGLEHAANRFGWGPYVPVHIGDDTTDEDAFKAAEQLGGFGIKVGEGATRAQARLENPTQVRNLLESIVNEGALTIA